MKVSEQRPALPLETQKSQNVRLVDIFFIGPVLIYMASQKKLSKPERGLMGILGGATIFYNLRNYLKNKS